VTFIGIMTSETTKRLTLPCAEGITASCTYLFGNYDESVIALHTPLKKGFVTKLRTHE
jgi:hypothetical protein